MKLLKSFIIFATATMAQLINQDTPVDQPSGQVQHDASVEPPVFDFYGDELEDKEEAIEEDHASDEAIVDTTSQNTAQDTDVKADDSLATTEDGKTSVEADEPDDAADVHEADNTLTVDDDSDNSNTDEDTFDPFSEPGSAMVEPVNDYFDEQTLSTKLTVGEKAHNMCNLGDVDQNTYRCDETKDEFLRCTATCPSGAGIIKQNCECYKYFGPLVLYE